MASPTPADIQSDARVAYGPLLSRPAAAQMGDKALWVDPSGDHALYQVQSGNWVQIGTGTAPPAPPSGVPTLRGPYTVDWSEIPHDGDKKTLWTPAVGDVLLRLFPDWQTVVQWDQGTVYVGQNVDGTVAPPVNVISLGDAFGVGAMSTPCLDMVIDANGNGGMRDGAGTPHTCTAYVCHTADPVQIQLAQTGGTDPTQGHVELYALVAQAVAP